VTTAGQLRHRFGFEKRAATDDSYGNTVAGDFVEQFVVAAAFEARFGGEAVTAARLTGQQPVTLTVRQSTQTRLIATDWRAHDKRSGVYYAIRSIVDPDPDHPGAWLDILCQAGVAP
jgi:head-tail adaptor